MKTSSKIYILFVRNKHIDNTVHIENIAWSVGFINPRVFNVNTWKELISLSEYLSGIKTNRRSTGNKVRARPFFSGIAGGNRVDEYNLREPHNIQFGKTYSQRNVRKRNSEQYFVHLER